MWFALGRSIFIEVRTAPGGRSSCRKVASRTKQTCSASPMFQCRFDRVEVLGVRLVFHRTFQTACIRQHVSLTFLLTISSFFSFYSDTVLEITCDSCMSLVFCLSVVCGWSICMSTLYEIHLMTSLSTWLPSISHSPCMMESKYHRVFRFVGLPGYIHFWPPAWTGLQTSHHVFVSGPPALSGFPYTDSKASGTDRLPCVCTSF